MRWYSWCDIWYCWSIIFWQAGKCVLLLFKLGLQLRQPWTPICQHFCFNLLPMENTSQHLLNSLSYKWKHFSIKYIPFHWKLRQNIISQESQVQFFQEVGNLYLPPTALNTIKPFIVKCAFLYGYIGDVWTKSETKSTFNISYPVKTHKRSKSTDILSVRIMRLRAF